VRPTDTNVDSVTTVNFYDCTAECRIIDNDDRETSEQNNFLYRVGEFDTNGGDVGTYEVKVYYNDTLYGSYGVS
jgi:hypothetical protein